MAYLDDRKRVSVAIVVMTLPAIALFLHRFIATTSTADSTSVMVDVLSALETVSRAAWLAPLFVLIQVSMIVRGTAGASWQNMLCVILTAAGALMMWTPQLGL